MLGNNANLQNVAVKVLTDAEFAGKLIANPVETLKAEGIEATPEMLDALKDVDVTQLQKLADDFKNSKAAL
jgi:hypothetical protein